MTQFENVIVIWNFAKKSFKKKLGKFQAIFVSSFFCPNITQGEKNECKNQKFIFLVVFSTKCSKTPLNRENMREQKTIQLNELYHRIRQHFAACCKNIALICVKREIIYKKRVFKTNTL